MNDSTGVILGALTLLLFVIVYVWYALALAAVFSKVGEATWKAWVPVVNVATVLSLGGFSPWLVLLNLIPLFGAIAFAVVFIVAIHRVNRGFDRGAGMTVLGAIIPVVWASILGFGSARWQGEEPGPRRSGRIDENSAPVRRGKDFEGPYVPLVGGWTPEPLPRADSVEQVDAEEPASEPIPLPFAAVSPSLSDAPAPSDWAPPASAGSFDLTPRTDDAPADPPASFRAPKPDDVRVDAPVPSAAQTPGDPRDSLSEVLAALRVGDDEPRPRDANPSTPAPEQADDGWNATPLTPAFSARERSVPTRESPRIPEPAAPSAPAGQDEPPFDLWGAPSSTDADAAAPAGDEPLTRPAPAPGSP